MQSFRRFTYTEHYPESHDASWVNDGTRMTRVIDVPWAQYAYAVQDILGYAQVYNTGLAEPNAAMILRTVPWAHPDFLSDGNQFLYATKISRVMPHGLPDQANGQPANVFAPGYSVMSPQISNNYKFARFTIEFETLPYDIRTDNDPLVQTLVGATLITDESRLNRYVTKLVNPSADYVSLGIGVMKYAGGGAAGSVVQFAPGKIAVNHDFEFRWELVPKEAVPSLAIDPTLSATEAAVEACLGKVNQDAFAGYPAGTLLLLAAVMTPIRSPIGRRIYTVGYRMKYFNPGHHKIFGPVNGTTGGWVEISSDGTAYAIQGPNPGPVTPDGKHIYDVCDMTTLFKPPKAQ
jgi:hypothetical protein